MNYIDVWFSLEYTKSLLLVLFGVLICWMFKVIERKEAGGKTR